MYRFFLLFAMLIAATIGCGESSSSSSSSSSTGGDDANTKKVGFSALTLKNPFFKIIADTMVEEGKKHGFKVIVMDAQDDVNSQAQHIDNFIAQKVTAIVINPADRIAIGPAVKKANEAGIPLFTNDLQCVAEGVEIAGHVGTDNFQGGRLAGEAMIEALGEAGGEVLVLHKNSANSCVLRVEGFREVIDEHNKDRQEGKIEIVKELDADGLRDKGVSVTADALQAHQNLAGIFAINDPSALGAHTALKQVNRQDQVVIIGFDGQVEGKQAIKNGDFYADPIQFPVKMGVVTIENIEKYLDGETFEKVQLIPTAIYKKEDAENDPDLE